MRVTQARGDVELEVLGVLNDVVSQPDVLNTLLLECQLLQHRLQDGVQLLPHVLQQHGGTKLDGVLQGAHVVGVRQLDYAQLVLLLQVLDPLVGLSCSQRQGLGVKKTTQTNKRGNATAQMTRIQVQNGTNYVSYDNKYTPVT